MNKYKTAIITNHSLRYFAGSELVTLDMARVLTSMGWKVHVGCFELGQPLRELFDAFEVGWIDLNKSAIDLDSEVGLLWGHHFTTFDRLLVDYGLRPRRVVYSSLSSFEPLEAPPLYFQWLSGISANSLETRECLLQLGVSSDKVFLFENCVLDHYFEMKRARQYAGLERVAVVSNHVPREVTKAMRFLAAHAHVDIYGFSHKSVQMTPELLQEYDLVVTIGRTVQQCFALKVPIYCYDRFGGPGYIDVSNFDLAAAYNFSGRCCKREMVAEELCADILNGYEAARSNLAYLQEAARRRFRFSSTTHELLRFVESSEYGGIPEALQRLLSRHLRYHERVSTKKRNPKSLPSAVDSERVMVSTEPSGSVVAAVRAIAFHLPQYHPIPENNRWWGKGFTEWTNVRQGKPTFDGHYQPHVPAEEVGYYELGDVSVLARQAALAREYGLEGFCFYHYWFDGKRLLEKPVDQLLRHPEIDLPFCLCWANENWTRRWDGGDQEVLIAQSYDPSLHERFARDLVPYFSDPRYIRVDGKPLLLVYRGDIIPDLANTLAAWRQAWRDAGIGEVYLVGVESFKVFLPEEVGFDANCEFLPHQVDAVRVAPDEPVRNPTLPFQFLGDYGKLADYWSERPRPHYKRFRCLVPSWDNSARRRKGRAGLFVNATPERYGQWLEHTLAKTCEEFAGDERLVFINAWNEWGEGCHLEPDVRHGRAYLEATRNALDKLKAATEIPVRPYNPFLEDYRSWLASRQLSHAERVHLPERLAAWSHAPRLLLVVDCQDATAEALRQTLVSVERQDYAAAGVWLRGGEPPALESSLPLRQLPETLDWAQLDAHLTQVEDVDWLLLLRAGDELDERALLLLAERIVTTPELACCYVDEDRLEGAERFDPFFKPDFNLDLMRSYPYCGRVLAFARGGLLAAGGFRGAMGELSPHDLLWRLLETRGFSAIGHIAEVLVHRRQSLGQWLAGAPVQEANARLVSAHLSRLGVGHAVGIGALPMINRVTYSHTGQPLVSIIVVARDRLPLLRRCVESLVEKTRYPNYELLIVDDASETPEARAWFEGMEALNSEQVRIVRCPHGGGRPALDNLAAGQARGDYYLLLGCDTAVVDPGWLDALLNHARRPEVGIVGPRLTAIDGSVRHAGLILGLQGAVGLAFQGEPAGASGYLHRLLVDQNYSAVSRDCMMVRAELWREIGGLDEALSGDLQTATDFCLKAHQAGYLTIWTPYAELLQGSTADQADPVVAGGDEDRLYERWLPRIAQDPAYSPALSLNSGFVLAAESERLPWQPFAERAVPSFLCYAADAFGSGQYRVVQPFAALEREGHAQGMISSYLLSPAHFERMRPDAVVLQRQYGPRGIEHIEKLKRLSPAFRVFELDDYLLELPSASVHRANFSGDIASVLARAVSLCDRLVVSTEPLAHALQHMHSDIRVLPNRLHPAWWSLQGGRRLSGKPRVGWAGGIGHGGDLALLAEVVKALAAEVDWVFMGMCPEELLPHVAEYHPGVHFDEYPRRLAGLDLDLALAPLEDNRFNVCKSNLRLLEYGACGFPVVCSDIDPYRGVLPVTRVRNRAEDWLEAIRAHLAEPDASRRQGVELQARVREEWLLTADAALAWGRAWLPD